MRVTSSSNFRRNVISAHPEGYIVCQRKSMRLSSILTFIFSGVTVTDPCSWCVPQLLYVLHQTSSSLPLFIIVFLSAQVSSSCFSYYLPGAAVSWGQPLTPPFFSARIRTSRHCWLWGATSVVKASPALCAQVRLRQWWKRTHQSASQILNEYLNCMLCPAGVFMEKPHPLYTHTSSSMFKFSTHQQTQSATTSDAHRSSVRPNSSTNQTGKTFSS